MIAVHLQKNNSLSRKKQMAMPIPVAIISIFTVAILKKAINAPRKNKTASPICIYTVKKEEQPLSLQKDGMGD